MLDKTLLLNEIEKMILDFQDKNGVKPRVLLLPTNLYNELNTDKAVSGLVVSLYDLEVKKADIEKMIVY